MVETLWCVVCVGGMCRLFEVALMCSHVCVACGQSKEKGGCVQINGCR